MGGPHRFAALAALLTAVADRSGAATGHRLVLTWDTPAIQARVAASDATPPYAFAKPELATGADRLGRAPPNALRLFHGWWKT